jgi:hypothetical protein
MAVQQTANSGLWLVVECFFCTSCRAKDLSMAESEGSLDGGERRIANVKISEPNASDLSVARQDD